MSLSEGQSQNSGTHESPPPRKSYWESFNKIMERGEKLGKIIRANEAIDTKLDSMQTFIQDKYDKLLTNQDKFAFKKTAEYLMKEMSSDGSLMAKIKGVPWSKIKIVKRNYIFKVPEAMSSWNNFYHLKVGVGDDGKLNFTWTDDADEEGIDKY